MKQLKQDTLSAEMTTLEELYTLTRAEHTEQSITFSTKQNQFSQQKFAHKTFGIVGITLWSVANAFVLIYKTVTKLNVC